MIALIACLMICQTGQADDPFAENRVMAAEQNEFVRKSLMANIKKTDEFLTGRLSFNDKIEAMTLFHQMKAMNKKIRGMSLIYNKRTIDLTKQLDNRIDRAFAKLNGLDQLETAKKPMETGAKKK